MDLGVFDGCVPRRSISHLIALFMQVAESSESCKLIHGLKASSINSPVKRLPHSCLVLAEMPKTVFLTKCFVIMKGVVQLSEQLERKTARETNCESVSESKQQHIHFG